MFIAVKVNGEGYIDATEAKILASDASKGVVIDKMYEDYEKEFNLAKKENSLENEDDELLQKEEFAEEVKQHVCIQYCHYHIQYELKEI